MTIEEFRDFANCLKNNYTIDFDKLPEFCDMAISALSEELSEDGTLTVHVSDGSKVKRVFVMGDNIFGGLYYPDSAENKGEWIPVTKGLPKEKTHVIVSVMNEGKPFVTADDYFCYGFDDWKDDVVAWMKTPEPYKGGDS